MALHLPTGSLKTLSGLEPASDLVSQSLLQGEQNSRERDHVKQMLCNNAETRKRKKKAKKVDMSDLFING